MMKNSSSSIHGVFILESYHWHRVKTSRQAYEWIARLSDSEIESLARVKTRITKGKIILIIIGVLE